MPNKNPTFWFDYDELYNSLNRQREAKGLSWRAVSSRMGVAASTIKRAEFGGPMEADGVRAMIAWLELAPEYFIRASNGRDVPAPKTMIPAYGRGVRRFDKRALFLALNNKRQAEGLNWPQVAKAIGNVSSSSLVNLNKGGRISVELMVSSCGWLGMSIEDLTYLSER